MINGYVYLICDPSNDLFKIGVTRNLNSKRLKQLQTGNGTELILKYLYPSEFPFEVEKRMHWKYNHKREVGEWFYLDVKEILNFMEDCKEKEETIRNIKEAQEKYKIIL